MRIWEGKGRRGLKGVGKGGKDLPQVKGGMKQSLAEAVMERRVTLMAVMVENFILDLKLFEFKFEFEFVSGCSCHWWRYFVFLLCFESRRVEYTLRLIKEKEK